MLSVESMRRLTKRHLPPSLARATKRMVVYPRYAAQVYACRRGFQQYGDRYPQPVLFIAGLPKSGTTWLKGMIAGYPGFHQLVIPGAIVHDMATGDAHDYDLPADMFARFKDMLVVTKMHVCGSLHNVQVLREAGVRYVVLYRDLRDVAVSYVFYVQQTPWHREYPVYARLSPREGLAVFAQRTLPAHADWVRSWQANRDADVSLVLRYEELLSDTAAIMTLVARHFELDSSPETVSRVVEAHSFRRLSEGRSQGQENTWSFFRKGIAGDWKNYFAPELKETYKSLVGDLLIEYGYEGDHLW